MKQDTWLRAQTAVMAGLALICGAGVVLSQRPAGLPRMNPSKMAQRQLVEMKDRLKLSGAQEAEIRPYLDEQDERMAEVWDKAAPGAPFTKEMMQAMHEDREVTARKIGEALTVEQTAEYQKKKNERRGLGPGSPRGGLSRQ